MVLMALRFATTISQPSGLSGMPPRLQSFSAWWRGILEDIFGQLKVMQAKETGKNGDHPSRLVTEKMVDQFPWIRWGAGHKLYIMGFSLRTSSRNSPRRGHDFVSSVASSMLSALMTI